MKERLRYSELVDWLGSEGLSERTVRKLIAQKIIKSYKYTPKDAWSYYVRSEVQRDVLEVKAEKLTL